MGEVAVESTHASCAEGASHWASDLGADATTYAFFVGKENGFKDLVVAVVNENFIDFVGACPVAGKKEGGDNVFFFELFAEVFGKVFEVVEGLGSLLVYPVSDLPSAIRFVPKLDDDLFKFSPGFSY